MWRIDLDGPTDGAGWRRAVKALIAAGIVPDAVRFTADSRSPGLFEAQPFDVPADPPALSLPAGFSALCDRVLLHDDEDRFEHLYAMAWRIAHDRAVWTDTLDPARRTLETMAHAVQREIHKMHAFVRFRPVPGGSPDEPECHVAWFDPAHHVVEAAAPFFVRRFTHQHWAILSPRGSVHWDGQQLTRGAPARADEAPGPDAGEVLWLTYYRSIFNPARLKVSMMKREMPVRYWANLPEAQQIASLVAEATPRAWQMVTAAPTERRRKRGQGRRDGGTLSPAADPGDTH